MNKVINIYVIQNLIFLYFMHSQKCKFYPFNVFVLLYLKMTRKQGRNMQPYSYCRTQKEL